METIQIEIVGSVDWLANLYIQKIFRWNVTGRRILLIALNYLLKVLHTELYYGVWTRKERLRIIGREANWWEDMEKRNIGK